MSETADAVCGGIDRRQAVREKARTPSLALSFPSRSRAHGRRRLRKHAAVAVADTCHRLISRSPRRSRYYATGERLSLQRPKPNRGHRPQPFSLVGRSCRIRPCFQQHMNRTAGHRIEHDRCEATMNAAHLRHRRHPVTLSDRPQRRAAPCVRWSGSRQQSTSPILSF